MKKKMKNKPIILFCVFFLMLPIAMSITLTEESLASGQLEFIGKMISKLSPSEFVNTVKYIELWEGNAFRNAKPELNLVKVFDSTHTNIVLGDSTKTIKNAAVLREGIHVGDETIDGGLKHIKFRHMGPDATASSRFPISFTESDVVDIVSDGLKYGHLRSSN